MDVTLTNFEEIFPEVKEGIETASFISFDGEFTGLSNGPTTHPFELPSDYYKKLWDGALDFLFVQCGLSVFRYNENIEKYSCKTYNFYIFPRQSFRDCPDIRFLCQASSLSFLIDNKFDFNKLIKEGIPYTTASDEESIRQAFIEREKYNEAASNNPLVAIPKQLEPTITSTMKLIEEFMESSAVEMTIENRNAFARKLIYQSVRKRYTDDTIFLQTKKGGVLYVKKGSSKAERAAEQERNLQNAVGFSRIIRALSESRKLIVGHSPLLDICHILHRFVDSLPDSYDEFKDMAHCVFPNIIDTKFMASNSCLNDLIPSKGLSQMIQSVKEKPFGGPEVEVAQGYGYDELKPHEAGYDAYMTGVCFIAFLDYLESDKKSKSTLFKNPLESVVVQKHLNKLSLIRIYDSYIDLEKADYIPSRDNIFYITFPSATTASNIRHILNKYENFHIHWETHESAFLEFKEPKEVSSLKSILTSKKKYCSDPGVTIIPFSKMKACSSISTSSYCSHSSPRPRNKRSSEESTFSDLQKKQRTSSIGSSKRSDTILKEEEDPAACLSQLEASTEGKQVTALFSTDDDWS